MSDDPSGYHAHLVRRAITAITLVVSLAGASACGRAPAAPTPQPPVTPQPPPPPQVAELPTRTQLLSVPPFELPPTQAVFPESVQLLRVPPYAPPPKPLAKLSVSVQLLTIPDGSHHTPPPLPSRF